MPPLVWLSPQQAADLGRKICGMAALLPDAAGQEDASDLIRVLMGGEGEG